MKFISAQNVALLVAAGLIASSGTAIAADTKDAAVARAQAQAAYQSSMSTYIACLLYTSPSPRDGLLSRMPSSA